MVAHGHAQAVGGIIIEKGGFDWNNGRFPEFVNPDPAYHGLVYTEAFPAAPYSVKLRAQWIRDIGAGMAPFNAYLSNLGVETLALQLVEKLRDLEEANEVVKDELRGERRDVSGRGRHAGTFGLRPAWMKKENRVRGK